MFAYDSIAIKALDWIQNNVHIFSLPPGDNPYFLQRVKPLGELTLTANLLINYPTSSSKCKKAGNALLNYCWNEFEKGLVLRDIIKIAPNLITISSVYQYFFENGFRDTIFEKLLVSTLKLRGVAALEFPSWRALELARAFNSLHLNSPWSLKKNYKNTWLFSEPEPWTINIDAAYSVTHTVFYQTNFGKYPELLGKRKIKYLLDWVPVWARYYYNADNFDLFAEMIIVLRCITKLINIETDWEVLLGQVQKNNGMVPGPSTGIYVAFDKTDDPERQIFFDNYHTTLVSLIAAMMSS